MGMRLREASLLGKDGFFVGIHADGYLSINTCLLS